MIILPFNYLRLIRIFFSCSFFFFILNMVNAQESISKDMPPKIKTSDVPTQKKLTYSQVCEKMKNEAGFPVVKNTGNKENDEVKHMESVAKWMKENPEKVKKYSKESSTK